MKTAPAAFHAMAKPTGAICNLDCEYCFFLSKELLYPGSRFRMADSLQEVYLRQLFESHRNAPEVVVAWQGGEPTIMGIDFFERALEIQREHARPGQRILNTLQTNGTLIDQEWAAFLKENGFLVGISIDGPEPIHDTYRVSKGGKPTFERVIRGLDHLKAKGVEWNVLTTLHAANADQGLPIYRFLRDQLEAEFIQFIPIIERANLENLERTELGWGAGLDRRTLYTQTGDLTTQRSISAQQYGRFMIDVFEEWVRHDVGSVYVQMFDTALANWVGDQGAMCVHAETCGRQVAVEHNGDVFSCDHFVEPAYLLGNITTEYLGDLVNSPTQQQFGLNKRDSLTQYCRTCDVRFACHGGCPKDRFGMSPDGEPGQHHLCAGYKEFFGHIDQPMRQMAGLLAQRESPAQIMRSYAAADAARGRNETCTCGSGRKWKQCHGR